MVLILILKFAFDSFICLFCKIITNLIIETMIQEFSVQNYLSFRDKQKIDFLATSERKLKEELTYEVKPGTRILRMALIYGANASGKSNLLNAIQALWLLMYSPLEKEDDEIPFYNPFQLQKDKPVFFEIIFWIKTTKYQYTIEYTEYEILYEKLMYTTDAGVLSLLYERKVGEEIKFGGTVDIKAKQKKDFNRETLKNHTVISTLNKKNIEAPQELTNLYNWIKLKVHELGIHNNALEIAEQALKDSSLKSMILDLLCRADFNITDFKIIENKISDKLREEIIRDDSISDDWKKKLLAPRKELFFVHQTGKESFELGFGLESAGTRVYFRLARILFELGMGGSIIMEDEIEDSLHYDLLIHYLQMFLQTSNDSQLIFTTHNQLLLDESWMLRRDMIWLVEKGRDTASSNLVRVSELGIHQNLSLLNAYRIGKMGAKPNLGSTILGSF